MLTQICALLKPGGHLILEEIDARAYAENQETPEAVTFFHDRLDERSASRGEACEIGSQIQPSLSKLRTFIDVTVETLAVSASL